MGKIQDEAAAVLTELREPESDGGWWRSWKNQAHMHSGREGDRLHRLHRLDRTQERREKGGRALDVLRGIKEPISNRRMKVLPSKDRGRNNK